MFTQVKTDGNTYIARKMRITNGKEAVDGVYVYNKDAKPDENGKINGEFMSVNTFMSQMIKDLPTINSQSAKAYLPNFVRTTPEERFDKQIESGARMSDGSILLRPTIMNTASTEVKPSKEEGKYDFITTSFVGGHAHEPSVETYSEDEIMENKWLSSGTVKLLDDGNYEVKYRSEENEGEWITEVVDKKGCIELMNKIQAHF